MIMMLTLGCAGSDTCPSGFFNAGGTCVDLANDRDNCGVQGNVCPSGHVCELGVCVLSCPGGMTDCTGVCRDLMTDDYNCGTCALTCAAGYRCTDGSCAPECPDGYTACSGHCKNLENDPSNCGDCGNACPAGEVCMAGTCTFTCPSPYIDCSGSCVDIDTDHLNCGACGDACLSGQVCEAGACQNSCLAGLTLCSGACVDLKRDPRNCGSCASRCASDEVCDGGTCILACTSGFTDCSGTCRDLDSDRMNCGSCDNVCDIAEVCDAGTCTFMCVSPLTDCSGVCTHLDDDPDNCGACGTVCSEIHATAYCASGSCGLIRDTDYDDCDVDVTTGCEAHLMRDTSNCGSCGTTCATDEVCYFGSCEFRTCRALPYSEMFYNGSSSPAQCTAWDTWRAGLDVTGCTSVTISGTYDTTGITCTDPVMVAEFATAITTGLRGEWSCDGHNWTICNRYSGEVWLDPPSLCSGSNCPNPGYLIRPCIGNLNWGGVNTATCSTNPDQEMTLTFY